MLMSHVIMEVFARMSQYPSLRHRNLDGFHEHRISVMVTPVFGINAAGHD